ncbi:hypothetical protein ABWI01_06750 [Oceanicaulis alexandrii]|uniref:hypothetical protein n=1 Tax=Oceanicaulis TaxID=153232 RepID=UPI0035D062B3
MSHLVGVGLIAAWLAFAVLAPRLASAEVTSLLALVGMALTLVVLFATGRLTRPDPLALNLTGRRPYWETRS